MVFYVLHRGSDIESFSPLLVLCRKLSIILFIVSTMHHHLTLQTVIGGTHDDLISNCYRWCMKVTTERTKYNYIERQREYNYHDYRSVLRTNYITYFSYKNKFKVFQPSPTVRVKLNAILILSLAEIKWKQNWSL